jgi:cobalt-zinc-cadmium efflux system outer membrane protein
MKADISILAAAVILASAGMAFAEPNQFLTLTDYLSFAEAHNAGLMSKKQQWIAAMEEVPQAKTLPDPKLTYGYFIEEVETRVGPQKQRAGITQTFPWFGKLDARGEAALKIAEAAGQMYREDQLALFREVKDGFYEFAYLARAIEIATDNLELLRHFEDVARTKYTASEAGQPDVIRAQVELARMEYVLRSLEQLRKPTVSKLNKALSLPEDTNLPWPKVEDFNAAGLEYGRLVNILRQKNPQLAGLDFKVMAAKSRTELAKKNFYPDISVGVDWIQTDRAIMPNVRDSGKDPVMLMFSINLPLWRDSYSAGLRQAQAITASIELEKIDAENTLLAKAAKSYYDYDDSIRRIRLYRDSLIPKGKELLTASETAYKAGTMDFLSLIDAQRLLLDYYLSYQRALADNRQKLAELEMLVGVELVSEGSN